MKTTDRPEAEKLGRDLLRRRAACASDAKCISAVQIEAINSYQSLGAPISLPEASASPPNSPVRITTAPPIYSNASIHFTFMSPVNGYTISGDWYPERMAESQGNLVGPAMFQFINNSSGTASRFASNNIALLDDGEWKEYGVDDLTPYYEHADQLIAKLAAFGTLQLASDSSVLGRMIPCPQNTTCLQLGKAIIDFQDVDFDGKKEMIINHRRAGQRDVDAYEIHSLEPSDDGAIVFNILDDSGRTEPLRSLDDMSEIMPDSRQIEIYSSDGACGSSRDTYGKSQEEYSEFHLVHHTEWQMNGDTEECFRFDYSVTVTDTGIPTYKLIARTLEKQ